MLKTRNIVDIKGKISESDKTFSLGIDILDRLYDAIILVDHTREYIASEKNFISLYVEIKKYYLFDLIRDNISAINKKLEEYRIYLSKNKEFFDMANEIKMIDVKKIKRKEKSSFSREIDSFTLIKLKKELREVYFKINIYQGKIELFQKRGLDTIDLLRLDKKMEEIEEKFKKLGKENEE